MTESSDSMTLTVPEMAKELHISRTKAYELACSEGFPTLRIGKRVLINRKGLIEWIDRQTLI